MPRKKMPPRYHAIRVFGGWRVWDRHDRKHIISRIDGGDEGKAHDTADGIANTLEAARTHNHGLWDDAKVIEDERHAFATSLAASGISNADFHAALAEFDEAARGLASRRFRRG